MAAKIIKGTEVAKEIRQELKREVEELKSKHGVTPGLVTILVGEDPASVSYVTAKQRTAHDLGFYSVQDNQPADISEEALLDLIDKYNKDPKIHGILVQLPLPKHIDETRVLYAIDPKKDVDAFHPVNVGKLLIGEPDFLPCTPHGIWQLLIRSGAKIEGAEVVIVGRSNIVGKPMAAMFLNRNATVSVCHVYTKNLVDYTKKADILVVATGVRGLIKGDMVKENSIVFDVGITWVDGKVYGDVVFDEVVERARLVSPVPGGVGPLTIATLLTHTVKAACKQKQEEGEEE